MVGLPLMFKCSGHVILLLKMTIRIILVGNKMNSKLICKKVIIIQYKTILNIFLMIWRKIVFRNKLILLLIMIIFNKVVVGALPKNAIFFEF